MRKLTTEDLYEEFMRLYTEEALLGNDCWFLKQSKQEIERAKYRRDRTSRIVRMVKRLKVGL